MWQVEHSNGNRNLYLTFKICGFQDISRTVSVIDKAIDGSQFSQFTKVLSKEYYSC